MTSPSSTSRSHDTTINRLHTIEEEYREKNTIEGRGHNIMYVRQEGERDYSRRLFISTGELSLPEGATAYFPNS